MYKKAYVTDWNSFDSQQLVLLKTSFIKMSDSNLVAVNSAALGVQMPEVTLPDGSRIQTGTVGALIVGMKAYDKHITAGLADQPRTTEIEQSFKAALPILKRPGLTDVFPPEEWLRGTSAGRRRVGELYLQWSKA